jgi:hypothetical protein
LPPKIHSSACVVAGKKKTKINTRKNLNTASSFREVTFKQVPEGGEGDRRVELQSLSGFESLARWKKERNPKDGESFQSSRLGHRGLAFPLVRFGFLRILHQTQGRQAVERLSEKKRSGA